MKMKNGVIKTTWEGGTIHAPICEALGCLFLDYKIIHEGTIGGFSITIEMVETGDMYDVFFTKQGEQVSIMPA